MINNPVCGVISAVNIKCNLEKFYNKKKTKVKIFKNKNLEKI